LQYNCQYQSKSMKEGINVMADVPQEIVDVHDSDEEKNILTWIWLDNWVVCNIHNLNSSLFMDMMQILYNLLSFTTVIRILIQNNCNILMKYFKQNNTI